MDSFDWNRSKEELLTESRTALRDIFEGTNYTMIRNPTMGERMNNIYCNGSDKRVAFLIPLRQSQDFTFVFNIEYLPIIQRSGAKLGELKEIKKNKDFKDERYICFYLHDQFFDKLHGIWFDYNKAIEIIKHFGGIITPDFSTNIDFPQGLKFFNTYRMRAFGYWVSTFGINVINNVRWSHDTKAYCFNGIPKNSVVCLGTSASGLTVKRNREEYESFLKLMIKKLKPKIILIYGSSNYSFFKELEEEGIIIKDYYHNWRK